MKKSTVVPIADIEACDSVTEYWREYVQRNRHKKLPSESLPPASEPPEPVFAHLRKR